MIRVNKNINEKNIEYGGCYIASGNTMTIGTGLELSWVCSGNLKMQIHNQTLVSLKLEQV